MAGEEIIYKKAVHTDIKKIISLQSKNSVINLSQKEIENEGFVTLKHSENLLLRMNDPHPHIIAKYKGEVIAYALVMLPSFRSEITDLEEMFLELDYLKMNKSPLSSFRFFIMGQICIAKEFRSKGVFRKLYKTMNSFMKDNFDFVITEIAVTNQRSLNAHLHIGFEKIASRISSKGEQWIIVKMDLK